jgi:hypothetical protein
MVGLVNFLVTTVRDNSATEQLPNNRSEKILRAIWKHSVDLRDELKP